MQAKRDILYDETAFHTIIQLMPKNFLSLSTLRVRAPRFGSVWLIFQKRFLRLKDLFEQAVPQNSFLESSCTKKWEAFFSHESFKILILFIIFVHNELKCYYYPN